MCLFFLCRDGEVGVGSLVSMDAGILDFEWTSTLRL